MKTKIFMLLMMVASSLFLVNCAKDNKNNNQNTGYYCTQYNSMGQCISTSGAYNNQCPAGQISTAQGCLQQNATCGVSAGYNPSTGQCVPATINGGMGYNGVCSQTDMVTTQYGTLQQGSCVQYCQQYGRKYGFYQGVYNGQNGQWCVPSMY